MQDDPNRQTEEVTVIARRGPFEVKFDEKEFNYLEPHLDCNALQDELKRVKDRIANVGQDIAKVSEVSFPILAKPYKEPVLPRLKFRFLSGPREIHPDANGRLTRLTVTDNLLVPRNGGTKAKATDQTSELDIDTMIFAIGDIVDPNLGLAHDNWNYLANPDTGDPDRAAYQVFDPEPGQVREGSYLVGWARKASEGLVGTARFDAERGAEQVLAYLEGAAEKKTATFEEVFDRLARKNIRAVTKDDLICLGRAEEACAKQRGLPSFKFAQDDEMLAAIEKEKTRPSKNNAAD
jgi:ferredoxin--NADP+ reductase